MATSLFFKDRRKARVKRNRVSREVAILHKEKRMKKKRKTVTAAQKWAWERCRLKGSLARAKGLLMVISNLNSITDYEFKKVNLALDELNLLLVLWEENQKKSRIKAGV